MLLGNSLKCHCSHLNIDWQLPGKRERGFKVVKEVSKKRRMPPGGEGAFPGAKTNPTCRSSFRTNPPHEPALGASTVCWQGPCVLRQSVHHTRVICCGNLLGLSLGPKCFGCRHPLSLSIVFQPFTAYSRLRKYGMNENFNLLFYAWL